MMLLHFCKSVKMPIFRNIQGFIFINCRYFKLSPLTHKKEQYYVVISGRNPGVYFSWKECEEQVNGYPKTDFKKFKRKGDVLNFLHKRVLALKESNSINTTDIQLLEKTYNNCKKKWLEPSSFSTDFITSEDCEPTVNKESLHDLSAVEEICEEDSTAQIQPLEEDSTAQIQPLEEDSTTQIQPLEEDSTAQIQPLDIDRLKDKGLTVDEDGYVVVYTDGSCLLTGTSEVVAGLGVYFGPWNPLNASLPLEGRKSCVRAEICAAVLALEIARREGFHRVKILTDSQLLVQYTTKWIKHWRCNNWLNYRGRTITNLDDVKKLDMMCSELDVKWVYVPGHSGVCGNEEADFLATSSSKKQLNDADSCSKGPS